MEKKPKGKLIPMPTPEAPPKIPAMPMELKGSALEHWNQHAEGLTKRGLLDDFTAHFFGIVCVAWRQYEDMARQICADGLMVPGPGGRMIAHPLLHHQAQAFRIYRLYAKDMGLAPRQARRLNDDL